MSVPGLVMHGAGDTAASFRRQFAHIEAATPDVAWSFPDADVRPDREAQLHYSGLGAARFNHPCWDIVELLPEAPRTVVFGFSMGAVTAMRLLHRAPERLSAVVCVAGCYSLLQAFSSGYTPPATPGPDILFVHGDADRHIPDALSRECADALTAHGYTADYLTVPGAGHSWSELGLGKPGGLTTRVAAWIGDTSRRGAER